MKNKACLIFIAIALSLSITKAEVVLTIDSVLCKTVSKDSFASIELHWAFYNNSKDTVRNIDEPWYKMSTMVENRVGNTRIKINQSDTVVFCDYPAVFETPLVNYKRSALPPSGFLKGIIGGIFKIIKKSDGSLSVQMEYDSRIENDGGKPLWRGQLLSNKIAFKCILQNDNDMYFTKELSIDSVCVEKVSSLVKNKLEFIPNSYKCISTNKYKRVIIYSLQPDSGKFVFDSPGAFVVINDTCGIDTIIIERD